MNQERIVYQSSTSVEPAYSTAGTIEGWLCGVATPGIGNSRLAFALAGAFAGPLLQPLGIEGGGSCFAVMRTPDRKDEETETVTSG